MTRGSIGLALLSAALLATGTFTPASAASVYYSRAANIQYTSNAVILTSAEAKDLTSTSADGSTYTFSKRTGDIGKLKAGSVMLIPGVTVRDVTSVKVHGAGVVVDTNPASLTDWSPTERCHGTRR